MYDRGKWYELTPRTKTRVKFGSRTSYCTRGPKKKRVYFGGNVRNRKFGKKFHGGVIDTGAHKTVIGRKQAKAYCKEHGVTMKLKPSLRRFLFGDQLQKSLGKMVLYLTTDRGPIPFEVDVVGIDIPLLFGLDFMDKHKAVPNIVRNQFEAAKWCVPITRKFGHLYVEMYYSVNYTHSELLKLHRQFHHPSTGKLLNVLKRIRPEDVDEGTKIVLDDIVKRCKPCQRNPTSKPQTFKVSIGTEDIRFNQEVALDIMYLDKRPVLHVVDLQTRLSAARFLKKISTEAVWNTFLECWVKTYVGHPNKLRVDRGAQFTSTGWHEFSEDAGIKLIMSGVEQHNALGAGERYHAPLRIVYNKIRDQFKDADADFLLSCAVYALNNTMGPDGLVPITLAFGIEPNTDPGKIKATNRERSKTQEEARKEMMRIVTEQKLKRAMRSKTPSTFDEVYEPGELIWVYREGHIGKPGTYTGPFEVVYTEDKHVFIKDAQNEPPRPYSKTAVKRYYEPSVESDRYMEEMHNTMMNIADERLGNVHRVHVTEVLSEKDPRASDSKMNEAKRKEIRGLIERGSFRVILREDIPEGANRLRARYVLAIKDAGTDKEVWKARYIVQGHRDLERDVLVRRSTTLQQRGVRLIMAMAAIHGFKLWTTDVAQAYLQSQGQLGREIFIDNPAKEFELTADQALQLLRPLYGLSESGDHWYEELDKHHREDLQMKTLDSDHSLYYKIIDGHIAGLSGTYVDDCIQTGTEDFDELTDKTATKYTVKAKEYGKGKIIGIEYEPVEDGIIVKQGGYIRKLKPLPEDCSFSDYRSKRAQIAWVQNTRPDIAFEVGYAAQVTEERFSLEKKGLVKRMNKVVQELRKTSNHAMKFPKLDKDTLRIVAYTDSSFANNYDLSSQLGYAVFLVDKNDNSAIISFRSFKARRITRSVLAAETLAFSDGFDQAFVLRRDIEQLLGKRIAITMLTDSQSLFDIITKSSYSTEKRILIDIACAKEAYRKKELSDIGLVGSKDNIADCLTKKTSGKDLLLVVTNGKLQMKVKQYVIRKKYFQVL